MIAMNKLFMFIDSAYVSTARSSGYDESIKIICELLSCYIESAVMVFRNGAAKSLACAYHAQAKQLAKYLRDQQTAAALSSGVAAIHQVMLNISLCDILKNHNADKDIVALVIPVAANTERLGALVVLRGSDFSPEELIISQAAATVLAANISAIKNEREAAERKDTSAVRAAIGTLSYSEMEAALEVFRRLPGDEGSIVAARIAGESNATRSAIVNALRKLESAGLLESHSRGVKGTFIKIRTPVLREELRKFDK